MPRLFLMRTRRSSRVSSGSAPTPDAAPRIVRAGASLHRPGWKVTSGTNAAPMYLTKRSNGLGAFRCRSIGGSIPVQLKERCSFPKKEKSQRMLEDAVWKIVVDDLGNMFTPEEAVVFAREAAKADTNDDGPRHRSFDQREKRANEKRQRAETLYLNGKRDSAWFDQVEQEVAAELAVIVDE